MTPRHKRAPAPAAQRGGARQLWRRLRTDRGAAVLETAFVSVFLLILFAGAMDVGRMFYSYIVITNAAREGARTAVRQPCDGLSASKVREGIETAVKRETGSLVDDLSATVAVAISPTVTAGCFAAETPVRVTVDLDYSNWFTAITGSEETVELSNYAVMIAGGSELAEDK
jgi:Flp pilus assembly protein TadG